MFMIPWGDVNEDDSYKLTLRICMSWFRWRHAVERSETSSYQRPQDKSAGRHSTGNTHTFTTLLWTHHYTVKSILYSPISQIIELPVFKLNYWRNDINTHRRLFFLHLFVSQSLESVQTGQRLWHIFLLLLSELGMNTFFFFLNPGNDSYFRYLG